jgi:hypothetical protein
MNAMINNIGERLVVKARVVNDFMESWLAGKEEGNLRRNPFYSELQGMLQMLKAMDIDFSIEYDNEVVKMTAIVVMGKKFEV